MSRRHRAEKRKIEAEPIYNSLLLSKFINKIIMDGKKSIARKIVYSAVEKFADKIKAKDPLIAFEKALENAKPALEVKSRRIGGATYQVPVEIASSRKEAIAMRWIIKNARAKKGKTMIDGLVVELFDCYNNQGVTIKKKDDMHRMAESNKAFAHYKW